MTRGMVEGGGALLDALRGVHWPARGAVPGSFTGTHHSRMRGNSAEFTEYRLYRQGDDPRRLDWRLLARSDRAYIRLATDRTVLRTMIVVDASTSMAYPEATRAKWVLAQRLALGLAAVAHADGDPVGVSIVAAGGTRLLPMRTRRGVVSEIARMLGESLPEGSAALAPAVTASSRAARIAIVSDFLGDAGELLRVAKERVAAGAEVHAVHVVADEELDPAPRAILAVDPEDSRQARPLVDETRDAYIAAFAAWRDDLARRWRAARAVYSIVSTGETASHAVRRIVSPVPLAATTRGAVGA